MQRDLRETPFDQPNHPGLDQDIGSSEFSPRLQDIATLGADHRVVGDAGNPGPLVKRGTEHTDNPLRRISDVKTWRNSEERAVPDRG